MGKWSDEWDSKTQDYVAKLVKFAGIMGLLVGFGIAVFFLYILPPIFDGVLVSMGLQEDIPNIDCTRLTEKYTADHVQYSYEDMGFYEWAKENICK